MTNIPSPPIPPAPVIAQAPVEQKISAQAEVEESAPFDGEDSAPPSPPTSVSAAPPSMPSPPPAPEQITSQPPPSTAVFQPAQEPAVSQDQQLTKTEASRTAPVAFDDSGFPVSGSFAEMAASLGFEGINFDSYGVVPNIVLRGGSFEKEGKDMGVTSFLVRIISSRKKYLYTYGPEGKKKVLYSYDQKVSSSGSMSLLDFQKEASEAGFEVKTVEFLEFSATLLETEELVNLSIPLLGSGSRVAKFIANCLASRRRPQDVITRVFRGARVESVTHPYYPWDFEIAQ